MGLDLAGRSIAITGASSGIGAATALACAEAGMRVSLFARRADRLEALRERIESGGRRAIVVVGSVDSDADCERLISETDRAFGSVDAVLANAGYGAEVGSLEMPDDELRAMLETNFFGSMRVARAAGVRMRGQGSGHIVMVSSCLSKIGVPRYAAYCASKAAQDHFARAMRHELRGEGIAVSSVHPIGTRTEFFDEAGKRSKGGATLLDRGSQRFMQPPERVARAIVRRLRRNKGGEVWTSLPTRVALGASVMLPGVTDAVLGRLYRKRMGG